MATHCLNLAPSNGELYYMHFCHVTFAISDAESVILIDPFLSGKFEWEGHTERHLQPSSIALLSIQRCNAVLISHEHMDHWDVPTIRALHNQTDAVFYAPQLTINRIAAAGLPTERFRPVHKFMKFAIGKIEITVYPSVEAEDKSEPVQRVGFLLEYNESCFYHQGDSHGPAKVWQEFSSRLDALIIWPVYMDSYVYQLRPRAVILHHMDRFDPGGFFCNNDPQREVEYWSYRHPEITFTAPSRGQWQSVKTHHIAGSEV